MKTKVMTIVGTRPEIIKLSRVISEFDKYTRHTLVHTGQTIISESSDYTSHNTNQLSVDEIKDKLLNLPFIKDQLDA